MWDKLTPLDKKLVRVAAIVALLEAIALTVWLVGA